MMLPRLAGISALALLASCRTVGPDYHLPKEAVFSSAQAQAPLQDEHTSRLQQQGSLPDAWWQLYRDPALDALVREALVANSDLKVADLNLKRAATVESLARSQGGFSAQAATSAERALISAESFLQDERLPTFSVAKGGIEASYAFDLFGKVRRGAEAASADTEAALAARDLVRVTVAARVTEHYLAICEARHDLRIAKQAVKLQQEAVDVAQRMRKTGRGTDFDVSRARALLSRSEAELPRYDQRIEASGYEVASLLGRPPGDVPASASKCEAAPEIRQPIPVGDGAALLRRRPDIRQAERKLAAATARIGVAVADLYPSISFGASAGTNGLLSDYGQHPALYWSVGPLIQWHIPTRDSRERVELARIGADVALAEFDRTVLDALKETQVALSDYARLAERQDALSRSLQEADVGAAQAEALYRGGKTTFIEALDAERTRIDTELALSEAKQAVSRAQVQVFLELGGGWRPPPA